MLKIVPLKMSDNTIHRLYLPCSYIIINTHIDAIIKSVRVKPDRKV